MNYETIRSKDIAARKRFVYKEDEVDNWRSHADDVIADKSWVGDCDDLTSTVIDLLARSGGSLSELYRLIVFTEQGVGHMIGAALDDKEQFWIIGDTFSDEPYPAEQLKHRPHEYNRMDETTATNTKWRDGLPWQ